MFIMEKMNFADHSFLPKRLRNTKLRNLFPAL